MKKKKLKKEYKKLVIENNHLFCENIRLKAQISGNNAVEKMTDEQILKIREISSNIIKAFKKAFNNQNGAAG